MGGYKIESFTTPEEAPFFTTSRSNQASRKNDVDILNYDETPGPFEDFVNVDSFMHDFEIESDK